MFYPLHNVTTWGHYISVTPSQKDSFWVCWRHKVAHGFDPKIAVTLQSHLSSIGYARKKDYVPSPNYFYFSLGHFSITAF